MTIWVQVYFSAATAVPVAADTSVTNGKQRLAKILARDMGPPLSQLRGSIGQALLLVTRIYKTRLAVTTRCRRYRGTGQAVCIIKEGISGTSGT